MWSLQFGDDDRGVVRPTAGPRAVELAERIADGIVGGPVAHRIPTATMFPGTVLDPGELRDSDRVRAAAGLWQVVGYHEAYAVAGADAIDAMPGGRAWRQELEGVATPGQRHLLTHEGHFTHLTARDRALLDHAADGMAVIGDAERIRQVLRRFADNGVGKVIYAPSGPDVARELRAFRAAAVIDGGRR
jgi:5,10-methylenetetrahydromethanopterin reductase